MPSGGPEGNQTFLCGAAQKESLNTQGASQGQIFQKIPTEFLLFFSDFGLKKPKRIHSRVAIGLVCRNSRFKQNKRVHFVWLFTKMNFLRGVLQDCELPEENEGF